MRDPALQPIETEWNGYRFRSRLEARWAVFFDTLGIPYEYEVQGYRIDGVSYLPDFWLPKQDCWFEVKPEYPGDAYRQMLKRLAMLSGKCVVIATQGDFRPVHTAFDPECGPYGPFLGAKLATLLNAYPEDFEGDFDSWDECLMCSPDEPNAPPFFAPFYAPFRLPIWGEHNRRFHPNTEHHASGDTPHLREAYRAARQARFEHGERRWPR